VPHARGRVEFAPLEDVNIRFEGRDWPVEGFTMIGVLRLDHLQACVEDVLARGVPGDFIEAGVWRGGASMFMRVLLRLHGIEDRAVFLADSFEGLPKANPAAYPAESTLMGLHQYEFLSVPLETVQDNFRRFGLLDERVRFVKGWFRDTLPGLTDATWSVIRLDGDLYESTIVSLESLYPNLAPGGYVIIDDYALRACRQAVDDYREREGIREPIQAIDWTGIHWQKLG
jgi:Macrocin-O-methyltransferase (TylF)